MSSDGRSASSDAPNVPRLSSDGVIGCAAECSAAVGGSSFDCAACFEYVELSSTMTEIGVEEVGDSHVLDCRVNVQWIVDEIAIATNGCERCRSEKEKDVRRESRRREEIVCRPRRMR